MSCTGIPGGAAFVALKTTKSPKEVGAFIEFLSQDANYAEMTARTGNIPASASVAKAGVTYTGSDAAKAALGVFSSQVASLSPTAYAFQGYKYNRAIMFPTVTRVSQAIVGELSDELALGKLSVDMYEAVKAAQK